MSEPQPSRPPKGSLWPGVAIGVVIALVVAGGAFGVVKLRDDDSKLAAAKADRSIFTGAVAAMTKKARGLEAPFAAADAVGAAIDLPFDEGLKKEREGFLKLVSGDQSKAQRYAFFAEREAAKIAGVPEGTGASSCSGAKVTSTCWKLLRRSERA